MKATYTKQQSDIDVLICGELPEPMVNSGEVLIRIGATALNHLDVFARAGPKNQASPGKLMKQLKIINVCTFPLRRGAGLNCPNDREQQVPVIKRIYRAWAVRTADWSRDIRLDGRAYPSATPALDMDDSAQ